MIEFRSSPEADLPGFFPWPINLTRTMLLSSLNFEYLMPSKRPSAHFSAILPGLQPKSLNHSMESASIPTSK